MTESTNVEESTEVIDMRVKELRYDDWGRPIGLKWPERPADPEAEARALKRARRGGNNSGAGGRPQQDLCKSGKHKMDEFGKPTGKPNGGRYCAACKNEKAKEKRARDKAEQAKREAAAQELASKEAT